MLAVMWAASLPEDNVSCFVGFPGLDQSKVSNDSFFHDVVPTVEFPHLHTFKTSYIHAVFI